MNSLYIECNSGAAGDMLMAALLDLYDDKEDFLYKMNNLGLENVSVSFREEKRNGITGKKIIVTVDGVEEESLDVIDNKQEHHEHEGNHEDDLILDSFYAFEGGYHDFLNSRNENKIDISEEIKKEVKEPTFPADSLYAFEESYSDFLNDRSRTIEHEHHHIPERAEEKIEIKHDEKNEDISFPADGLYAFEVGFDDYLKARETLHSHHEHDCGHEHYHHGHAHNHEPLHVHGHHHKHNHNDIKHINNIIDKLNLSKNVKHHAKEIYNLILKAEAKAHGCSVDKVHFHEVGNLDAIVDIVGVCYLIDKLDIDNIICSPLNVGYGNVRTAHGILPVPAPATAYILRDVPTYTNEEKGELTTPTGAAILKHFVKEFTNRRNMTYEKIGYGLGKKELKSANFVRVFLGKINDEDKLKDKIFKLSCNIDDMTGEEIGLAIDKLWDNGALDVYTIPVNMKKNRPGVILEVLMKEEVEERLLNVIMKYTSTFGVRRSEYDRYILNRTFKEKETKYGSIKEKVGSGYGIEKSKLEFDDLKEVSDKYKIPIRDIK
ncbi:nickel pincer cofactor biosynthesis protein LarC [Anaerofustis stercorihominis]|uniref:nickel pincer cofactor biosynthesis protein LarC n=1 Tax=Anaerofustis stercorihominis TaxID=214853 RepID=UPI00214BB9D0|nr:nickel pincer cofactor biosynthesis protein LarC [Anaerofustis stercorihominis]MCR2032203.1 nickel pincer cofactor biosynthesis protein LarC [Anaerofustis stercorihominis]